MHMAMGVAVAVRMVTAVLTIGPRFRFKRCCRKVRLQPQAAEHVVQHVIMRVADFTLENL
jgi:hypothetical protein